jgi:hypothetical protein
MITFGLRLNTKLKAISQYVGYNFNSLCCFNGSILGSNDSGIFTTGGDADNNTSITAFFKTFSTDFGSARNKNTRTAVISGVFPKIQLTTVIDNTEKTSCNSLKDVTLEQKSVELKINHADTGKYIGVKVSNIEGSDFSIDQINLVVGATQKLNYYEAIVGRTRVDIPTLT